MMPPHAYASTVQVIVSSDFPWLGGTIFCPMQAYEFHIDSLTGIGVKYIPQK